jgi:hypothetical protein
VLGRLARGALDLLVALVTDQEDLEVVAGEPHGLTVHLGDEGAGGVDGLEATICCALHDGGRDTVGGEDDVRALRHLVDLVDEDGAALLERRHDVLVVHDLLAHVDGGAVVLERLLDGHDGPVDSCTIAAWGRQEHTLVTGHRVIL